MIARLAGRRTAKHLALVLAAGLLAAAVSRVAPQRHLIQGWLVDATAAARAIVFGTRPFADAGALVVTVGERSLAAPELSGLPRALFSPVWADLTARALGAGARTIAFDFIMAFDAGRMVIDGETPLGSFDRAFLGLLHAEGSTGRIILGRSARVLPAPRFQRVLGADRLALVEAPVGPGGVVRRVRSAITGTGGTPVGTLSGVALQSAGVAPPAVTSIVPPAPLDTIPSVELIDVLRCDEAAPMAEVFAGRLVFVGSALPGEDRLKGPGRLIPEPASPPPPARARDRAPDDPCRLMAGDHRAAYGGSVPGVFLHAAAVDAVLSGWAPAVAPLWLRLVLTGTAAAAGAALAIFGRLRSAIAGVALLTLAVFAGGAVLLEMGVLLESADPLLAGPAFFAAGWAVRIAVLDARARAIRHDFGRYLAPALIERMIDEERAPELGGESRNVTVMFADLSGFTRLSGELSEKALFPVLNRYLDALARIVRAHGGYVDKFVGDAVMAVWNAPADLPDHARRAVEAGLAMSRAVDGISAAAAAAGEPGLKLKVALNTGPALVGNVGSRERMNYTVIGATVNIASRLEDLPRVFDTRVIMGDATARAIERDFLVLPVATVQLDGVSGPFGIHSPLVPAGEADERLRALVADYARAGQFVAAGTFAEAAAIWDRLAGANWPGAGPSAVMRRRALAERDRAGGGRGPP